MEIHSSILAWETPCIEKPHGLQSRGSQKELDTTQLLNNKLVETIVPFSQDRYVKGPIHAYIMPNIRFIRKQILFSRPKQSLINTSNIGANSHLRKWQSHSLLWRKSVTKKIVFYTIPYHKSAISQDSTMERTRHPVILNIDYNLLYFLLILGQSKANFNFYLLSESKAVQIPSVTPALKNQMLKKYKKQSKVVLNNIFLKNVYH